MLYIMESLSPGEHIIQPTGYHWIFVFHRFVTFLFFCVLAIAVVVIGAIYHKYPTLPPWKIPDAWHYMTFTEILRGFWSAHFILRISAFLLVMLGLMHIAIAMIIRATTEIAVTNRRLIFKQGIIARKVNELKIENIEGINVSQSIMGRILNYGQMSAHGTGIGEIHFPDYMADPVAFRRAIQSARSPGLSTDDVRSQHHVYQADEDNELAQATARHQRPRGSVDI
ncbi:MAG TPA: PH domain-containing protein [Alphaproteobacteria bacterium]